MTDLEGDCDTLQAKRMRGNEEARTSKDDDHAEAEFVALGDIMNRYLSNSHGTAQTSII